MRKGFSLFALVLLLTMVTLAVCYAHKSKLVETFDVKLDETVTLDFGQCRVYVEGWDKDYVEVKYLTRLNGNIDSSVAAAIENADFSDKDYKLIQEGNTIKLADFESAKFLIYKLQTWLPLMQLERYSDDIAKKMGSTTNIGVNTSSVFVTQFEVHVPRNTPTRIKASNSAGGNFNMVE